MKMHNIHRDIDIEFCKKKFANFSKISIWIDQNPEKNLNYPDSKFVAEQWSGGSPVGLNCSGTCKIKTKWKQYRYVIINKLELWIQYETDVVFKPSYIILKSICSKEFFSCVWINSTIKNSIMKIF